MALPIGQSTEVSSRSRNEPGIYRHKESGAELITSSADGALAEGVAQADALVRVGYVRVGDVPSPEEIRDMQRKQAEADKAAEAKDKDTKKGTN